MPNINTKSQHTKIPTKWDGAIRMVLHYATTCINIYNGVLLYYITGCPTRADVAFVLDASGSVGEPNFVLVKNLVSRIVDELNINADNTRVGSVTYSSDSRLGFYMNQYTDKDKLKCAISGLDYKYGNTNTAAALKLTRDRILDQQYGARDTVNDFGMYVWHV